MAPRCVLSLIFVLGLLAIAACSSPSSTGKLRRQGPKVNIPDFIKHTAAYKGKTITLGLKVDEAIAKDQRQSLRDFVGRPVKFTTTAPTGEQLILIVTLPTGMSVPDVGHADDVVVTFVCQRGNLREGNEAKVIQTSEGPWEDAD
jgi:hypothetical protein